MVDYRIKAIWLLCGAAGFVSGCAHIKEAGRTIGHTTRDVTREIGHGTRDVAKHTSFMSLPIPYNGPAEMIRHSRCRRFV